MSEIEIINKPDVKWFLDTESIYTTLDNWDNVKSFLFNNDETILHISIKEMYDRIGENVCFHPKYLPNNIKAFEKQYKYYYKNKKLCKLE